jgi:hypothetical protein
VSHTLAKAVPWQQRLRNAIDALAGRTPEPDLRHPKVIAMNNQAARRSLALHIIESTLTDPEYEYDCGSDADYCTPLTDLVQKLAVSYKQAVSAPDDLSIEALIKRPSTPAITSPT